MDDVSVPDTPPASSSTNASSSKSSSRDQSGLEVDLASVSHLICLALATRMAELHVASTKVCSGGIA